jgi:hypothetical protein
MTIEAQQLETWIGTEVLDSDGAKLGKLEDVYFRESEPLVVGIRSGLGGRKHHVATLRGASVSQASLHLDTAADALVAADAAGISATQLSALATQDDRLQSIQAGDLEGWTAREARLKALAEAEAGAVKLEDEARLRAAEEDAASAKARDAEMDAATARRAREEAELQAQRAREDATPDA